VNGDGRGPAGGTPGTPGPAGVDGDVVYHGYRPKGGGAAVIFVETRGGERLGTVRHVRRHSPEGMSWGYAGSGPADCARSLLIAALGDDVARCASCAGTHRIVYDEAAGGDVPFDPAGDHDPQLVADCCSCDDGYIALPYQLFKRDVIAGLGPEWRMERATVLAWYGKAAGLT
jgi:hypothetical protein